MANFESTIGVAIQFILCAVFVILILCVFYLRGRKHDNIPLLPNYTSILGHLPFLLKHHDRFHDVMSEQLIQGKYEIGASSIFGRQSIFLQNPQLIKYIFETRFEDFEKGNRLRERYQVLLGNGIFLTDPPKWKWHRKIASRMFSMRNLKDFMFECMVDTTNQLNNKLKSMIKLENQSRSNEIVIDINDLLGRLTLECFVKIAFGYSLNLIENFPSKNEFGEAFDDTVERIAQRNHNILWKAFRYFNIASEKAIAQNAKIIDNFARDILRHRNSNNNLIFDRIGDNNINTDSSTDNTNDTNNNNGDSGRCDLLSLFIKYHDSKKDGPLTFEDLKSVAMNFIIAGRDTTRMLLSWFLYVLLYQCTNDEKLKHLNKIKKEISDIIESHGTIEYGDAMNGMKYLEACLLETLRLYPPVPFLVRCAKKDVKLPSIITQDLNEKGLKIEKSYIIRKNDRVFVHPWSLGRDERIFGKNCQNFDPSRFEKKGLNTFDPYVFTAFNIAPRLCLGRKFALMEAKIFLFHFLQCFQFEKFENFKVEYSVGAILNMKDGFKIRLRQC